MRLSPSGLAALGAGPGDISIDGAVPATLSGVVGSTPMWLSNTLLAYIDNGGTIDTYNLSAPAIATIDANPADDLRAGLSLWAAWNNTAAPVGVRSNYAGDPALLVDSKLADVSEAGLLCVYADAARPSGLRVYSAAGALLANLSGEPDLAVVCRNGIVAYHDVPGGWHLKNATTGVPLIYERATVPAPTDIIPLLSGTRQIVVEQSDPAGVHRVIARAANSKKSYIIVDGQATFGLDAVILPSGVLRVAWSTTANEEAIELRLIDLNLDTGAFSTGTAATGAIVWTVAAPLRMRALVASSGLEADLYPPAKHPTNDEETRLVTQPWMRYFEQLSKIVTGSIGMERLDGLLDQTHGGTGLPTGLTELDAANIIFGTLPQAVKWKEVTTVATGTQAAFDFDSADLLRCNNATALSFAGLVEGVAAERLVMVAVGVGTVTLLHEDAGATGAANRIDTPTGGSIVLTPGGTQDLAFLTRDATTGRWRVMFPNTAAIEDAVLHPFLLMGG